MTKKTVYILGILLTILIGTILFWLYCCKGKPEKTGVKPEDEIVSNFAMSGNGFEYQCGENFRFPLNGFDFIQPVGECINQGIGLLKSSLESNPLQKLLITGFCLPDETNNSGFPNLGMARANALKNYFVSLGIPETAIEVAGEIRSGLQVKEKIVFGPASFTVVQTETKPESLVIYFKSGQSGTALIPEQEAKLSDRVKFLEKVPGAKLTITGHTDNVGSREANMRLGQVRADFVKNWFVKKGIAESRIQTGSRGPDDPAADNSTADGKALNRRAVITIN